MKRERVVERTFSGYRLNLPEGIRLFILTREGERIELTEESPGISYWMRQKANVILADFGKV